MQTFWFCCICILFVVGCSKNTNDRIPTTLIGSSVQQSQINIESYLNAIKSDPDNDALYYHLALNYMFLNRTDEAYGAIQIALQLKPTNSEYIKVIIACLYQKRLYYEALDYLKKLEINPNTNQALYEMALDVYQKTGNARMGIRLLEKDLRLLNSEMLLSKKAHFYALLGDTTQAITYYDQALGKNPRAPDALVGLSGLVLQLGDVTNAKPMLLQALQIDTTLVQAKLLLGRLYQLSNNTDSSIFYYQQLSQLDSTNALYNASLATLFYRKKAYLKATTYYNKVLNRNKLEPSQQFEMAVSLYKLKMYREALPFFEKVDSIDVNNYNFAQQSISDIKRRLLLNNGIN